MDELCYLCERTEDDCECCFDCSRLDCVCDGSPVGETKVEKLELELVAIRTMADACQCETCCWIVAHADRVLA